MQRPLRWATLGYYFEFLKGEIDRLPRCPILMGHSMGGALTQWYLKYGGELPAAVLVAPWTSHNMLPSMLRSAWRDPLGVFLCELTLTSTPAVRNPARAAEMFIRNHGNMQDHPTPVGRGRNRTDRWTAVEVKTE